MKKVADAKELDRTRTRMRFGYLYNEYRDKHYYWEIAKIIFKNLIIIVLSYYESFVKMKAILIIVIIIIFIAMTNYMHPYKEKYLNKLEV